MDRLAYLALAAALVEAPHLLGGRPHVWTQGESSY